MPNAGPLVPSGAGPEERMEDPALPSGRPFLLAGGVRRASVHTALLQALCERSSSCVSPCWLPQGLRAYPALARHVAETGESGEAGRSALQGKGGRGPGSQGC